MKHSNPDFFTHVDRPLWFAARASAFAALCAFGMQPFAASAQVTVDASAATRATLGVSGNGTQLVNIVAPNAAGVSNNRFTQYNVGAGGLIVNNATQAVQTQTGGAVAANAALGKQGANVILMQVTGGAPSQLLGATEIAGRAANLVVANPAGITCSGCGFLNAPRVTLATGTPILANDGSLQAFDVKQGKIEVQGKGLDGSTSAIDLISRAMVINGKVQAKSIDAVAGANRVDYASKNAVAQSGTGAAPQVAIDVQALGSMYGDGAVRLIGTEAGMGVRDNGTISSLNGGLDVSSNGDVTIGAGSRMQARSGVNMNGVNVTNAGTVSGDGVSMNGMQSFVNNGGTISANREATLGGNQLTLGGGNVSAATLTLNGQTIVNNGATVKAGQTLTMYANRIDNAGTLSSGGDARINAQDTFANANGKLSAQNNVTFAGATLDNSKGEINVLQGDVYASGARVVNAGGTLNAGQMLSLDAQGIDNTKGTMSAGTARLNVVGDLNNAGGAITAKNGANVNVQGAFANTNGTLKSDDALTLQAGPIDNRNGVISTGRGALQVAGMDVRNGGGRIVSGDALGLRAVSLDNAAGSIAAARDVTLAVNDKLVNDGGSITSKTVIDGSAGSLSNTNGTIAAPIHADIRLSANGMVLPSGGGTSGGATGGDVPPPPVPAPIAFDPGPDYVRVTPQAYDPNQYASGFWAPDGYFYGYTASTSRTGATVVPGVVVGVTTQAMR
ncbi:two-partner secretion domain-containing protein [Paraburkholderia flagellata]|uniref:two-partner secretion domain-containing protein n=1 Tax=Paraburkholderia flagellata TaxID=2883241 RepID=UPI001F39BF04|nr:filamentous hemagglutinin N-terminal domain-containing protein [Paraburkholderia flagellata]